MYLSENLVSVVYNSVKALFKLNIWVSNDDKAQGMR